MKALLSKRFAKITVSLAAVLLCSSAAYALTLDKPEPAISNQVEVRQSKDEEPTVDVPEVVEEVDTLEQPETSVVETPVVPAPQPPIRDEIIAKAKAQSIANLHYLVAEKDRSPGDDFVHWFCMEKLINSEQGPGFDDEGKVMSFIDDWKFTSFMAGTCMVVRYEPR